MEWASPDSLLGQTIDRFRLDAFLGGGTESLVFKAFDTEHLQTVAIKVIPGKEDAALPEKDRIRLEEARKRLVREVEAAGCLAHPNIVSIYAHGQTGDFDYVCMEFLQGRTLTQVFNEDRILTIQEAAGIFEQVLMALNAAHDRRIVHRDIKPGNIMITDQGIVKVMDFGVAKMPSLSMLRTGTVYGTPYYMSPEQITGQEVDIRSDIFSLGAVIYEALTGERPFEADNTATLAYKIVQMEPIPPDVLNIHIPRAWANIIRRALAKHPGERFQDPMEMLRALRAAKPEEHVHVHDRQDAAPSSKPAESGEDAATVPLLAEGGDEEGGKPSAHRLSEQTACQTPADSAAAPRRPTLAAFRWEDLVSRAGGSGYACVPKKGRVIWGWVSALCFFLVLIGGGILWWQYFREPGGMTPPSSAGPGGETGSSDALKQAESWVMEAKAAMERDPARAQSLLEKAVARHSKHFEALFLLGQLMHNRRDYQGAVKRYEEALRLNGSSAELYFNLGCAYMAIGELDAAIRSYGSCLELKPAYGDEVLTNLAVIYLKKDDPEKAEQFFRKALVLNPENAIARKHLMESQRTTYQQALSSVSPGIGYAERPGEMRVSAASTLPREALLGGNDQDSADHLVAEAKEMFDKDPENARRLLEEAILIAPFHFDARFQLGRLLTFQKQFKQAMEHYEKALEVNDKSPDVFFNLGYVHMILKNYDSAIAYYEACRALSPPYQDEVLTNLGISHLKKNNLRQAEELFREATQMNPDNRIALNYLKKMAEKKKRKL
ncbi:MAG: tetratricopeptide repeat protein [Deltaproteobacteria bacterium]|nr:tetratricopeptide repeat protein [Deltaproteobacteria bacterium]